MSNNLLRILFIEDLPSDVDLAVLELRKGKLIFEYITVCTRADLIKALKEFKPDLIISDYMMPAFNGFQALKVAKELQPEIPFILCTGSVNEETAVECLKAGAVDYVIKEHMTRLPFAVKEALEQVVILKEKRASELLLSENEEKLQSIFSAAPVGIGLVINRKYVEVNDSFCRMTGYALNEIIGKSSVMMYPTKEEFEISGLEKYRQIATSGIGSVETRLKCKDGRILNIISTSTPLDPEDLSKGVTFTVLDITARKQTEIALRDSEERFRTLYNDAVAGLYRTNAEGEILLANRALVKMLGFNSFEELSAINLNRSGIGTTRQRNLFIDKIEKEREIKDMEAVWVCHDGKEIYVRESSKTICDTDGKILYYDGTVEDITHRKNIEEALKASQQLFETLAKSSPVGIFRTNIEGYTTYVNPKWLELSDLTIKEAMGTDWIKAVHPDDRKQLKEKWESDIKAMRNSTAEYRFQKSDGSIVWVIGNAIPELIDNKINGYIGTVTDITERKSTEEALVESETKYRQLVTHSPDGIFIIDLNGKLISANKAICDGLKYSSEELHSMNIWEIVPKHYQPVFKDRLKSILNGESTKGNIEYEAIGKDGITHTIEVLSVPYYKGKEIVGFQGIARDITESKHVAKALRESEERYKELFLNNPVPTYIFDENTLEFVEVNDTAMHNYGYSREEFAVMTLKDIRVPEDIKDLLEAIKELGKEVYYSLTIRHRKKDGTIFPVEITSHSLPVKNGRKTRLVIAIDITNRVIASEQMKLAKEKAEASDKLKTTFLNNISHEVRTPLNGILGFAEIMSQPDLSAVDRNVSLLMLNESSNRLLDTITNYMDISLLTSGNLTVYKKDFNPGQILRKVFDTYETICLNRKLKLSLEIPEDAEKMQYSSDPEIFRKIICHLMNNAIKFTEKGSINYGYIISENEIEFFVKDTGIGIGKESVNSIFDHFVKEDRGPTKLSEGSGLGLSIAKGMIDILGGTMKVESELEVGSCFIFTLPLLKDSEKSLSDITGGETRKSLDGGSILVAEDDETNFFYIKAILTRETKSIILQASNGREAVDLFRANPGIKLILMDVKMPEMDGLEATRQIKQLDQNVPIIAITAYAMLGDEEKVLASGCDDYLSKPISKKILLEKIAKFIKV